MKAKTVLTVLLLVFAAASVVAIVVKEAGRSPAPAPAESEGASPAAETAAESVHVETAGEAARTDRRIIAYYFHGNVRCDTCRTIEAYTKEAVDAGFPEALEDGRLEWRVVNVEEPGNEHFVQVYQLVTRSVVLVDMTGGSQKAWRNLVRVWELVGDKDAFVKYIQDETRACLEGSAQ